MTRGVAFTVPGKPVTRQRRAFIINGRAVITVDASSRKYEQNVRTFAQLAVAAAEHAGDLYQAALEVTVWAYLPVPKSWPAWKKDQALAGILMPTKKPDIDNLVKAAFDACTQIVWKDDCFICDQHVHKRYSDTPRLEMTIGRSPLPMDIEEGLAESVGLDFGKFVNQGKCGGCGVTLWGPRGQARDYCGACAPKMEAA